MSGPDVIAENEVILKRLSNGDDNVKRLADLSLRSTSFGIKPRPSEEYPSWSRENITSPERLLEIEAEKGRDLSGWRVAAICVSTARELGLLVVASPTEEDPGHCHIEPASGESFSDKLWSKLAKKTWIAYENPSDES